MSLGVTLRIDPRPHDGERTGANFRRLRELFDQLSDVDPEARGARLAALAVLEPELAAELAVLFDHADRSRSPLDSLAAVAVADVPVEVPGYRMGRLVGRGGSSWVYLADQDLDGIERRVALKIIGGIEADRFLQRFEAEKRILAGLEHPGIARLYDAGRTGGGFAFLAMEYVEANGSRPRRTSSRSASCSTSCWSASARTSPRRWAASSNGAIGRFCCRCRARHSPSAEKPGRRRTTRAPSRGTSTRS